MPDRKAQPEEITWSESIWLNSRGCRTYEDVFINGETGEKYVLMWNGKAHREVEVYIPAEHGCILRGNKFKNHERNSI